ncbi:DUF2255 family protein [Mycobacterium sherrisii]|uniref:DUF2255 family protein n=1 Tax=Mycobacterium sherrisii TaxID=243061 RepID=UPI0013020049|nr:DUF2255 family protein [Mycobacterium sherrisii]MCV7029519.1 DUF2255 family protein [Mycobacterium sherrisii]
MRSQPTSGAGACRRLDDAVCVQRVTFDSSGEVLAGDMYLPGPSTGGPRPAVVVAGAWATVKEQMAAGYARELAARGYIAMAFDFRSWGRSGGQPRSMEDPAAKSADIVAAAEFLARHAAVDFDAIGGLGICAGSSYLVAAATVSPLIKSLVLVAPALPTRADVRQNLGGEQNMAALIAAAEQASAEYERSGQQRLVPAVPPADDDRAARESYFSDPDRGLIPEWDNTFNPASWSRWIPFDVHALAHRLAQPTCVVHSDVAVNPDSVRAFLSKVSGPVDQLSLDGLSQFDFYDQPHAMAAATGAAVAHFSRTLRPAGATALLDHLAASEVVTIGTITTRGHVINTLVGAVVVDDAGYIRSQHGAKAKWYRRATRVPHGFVIHDAARFPVGFSRVTDAETIHRVDRAAYRKYGGKVRSLLLRPLLWRTRHHVLKITPQGCPTD